MVKITYDLNNAEDVKLVNDYFWFEYELKGLQFDIFNNKDLVIELIDVYKQQILIFLL